MPILGALLVSLFAGIAEFLVKFLSKKLAISLAAVTVLGTLTVGMFAALSVVFGGAVGAFPDYPGIATAVWVATPPAVSASISAVIGVDAAVAIYKWNVENLRLVSQS